MKTIEELYKEMLADKKLNVQGLEAINAGKAEEFLKANDCSATVEEAKAFIENQKEVSLDELDFVAGGCGGGGGASHYSE